MEALLDLRQGEVREVIRQEGEEGAAHEGEIGEGVRVARARAVLAPDGVAVPVVADFDAGPVVSRVMLIPDYGFGSNHAGADSRAESVVRSVVGISDRQMRQAVVMPDVMA